MKQIANNFRAGKNGHKVRLERNGKNRTGKVAFIMSRFPKLTETFILYEIIALEELGLKTEIYPLLRERQPVSHPEAAQMVKRANFHPFLSLKILFAQLYFMAKRPSAYLKVWLEVISGTWGSLNFLVGAIGVFPKSVRFAYEMQKKGVTHVHAHFATHPAVSALIINRLVNIPFSFTAHGSDLHVERRMLDRKIEASAFTVAISEYNKELMVSECGEDLRHKIHVIHCGVDLDAFKESTKYNPQGQLNILCVASFEEVKGHKYLIEACHFLKQNRVEFRCNLVGDGPLMQEIKGLVDRLGLTDECILHGPMSRKQVIAMLDSADIFALPSVPTKNGKREGIPVVLMEAMACGLPVVSSKLSGIPELVAHGESGLLIPPCDAIALAEAFYYLHCNPEQRTQMGTKGRMTIMNEFDLRANAAKLAEHFVQNRPEFLPTVSAGGIN